MYNRKVLQQILRDRREELEFTKREVADRAGLHFTHIGKLEKEDRDPGLGTIIKVCKALDLSPVDVLRRVLL